MKKVPCEIYSRVVGYFRPIQNWNLGKIAEFEDRVPYSVTASLAHAPAGSETCQSCCGEGHVEGIRVKADGEEEPCAVTCCECGGAGNVATPQMLAVAAA